MINRPDRAVPKWFFAGLVGLLSVGALATSLEAQARKNHSSSKVYIAEVTGDAIIATGDQIHDLTKRSVHTAEGSVIETKRAAANNERSRAFSTMVYSNGTGAYFDSDTRLEVRRFMQEPFTPQRTDMDVEPSVSQMNVFLARGLVALSTSKLNAGSHLVYQTPHASINIRGRQLVIETDSETTKISMLEGESVVRAGPHDMGGHVVRSGQQAVVRKGAVGQTNQIEIKPIPEDEFAQLHGKVAMASMAKRTVYFEERERQSEGLEDDDMLGLTPGSAVTAFDEPAGTGGSWREILPVEVVPANLPVQYTISPAQIITSGKDRRGG